MNLLLNKFLIIKTLLYMVGFGILGYMYISKTSSPGSVASMEIGTGARQSICFEKHCFDSQIADSEQEREQGLMNLTLLPIQSGMLFVFPQEGRYSFWMKNTLIPLDILWIDHQSRVVDIQTVQPCDLDPCPSYMPSGSGLYVLEINAGISKLLGIKIGSIAYISKK